MQPDTVGHNPHVAVYQEVGGVRARTLFQEAGLVVWRGEAWVGVWGACSSVTKKASAEA